MSHEIDQFELKKISINLRVVADFRVANNRSDATDFFFFFWRISFSLISHNII